MCNEYFESLGFYVYGYREKDSDKYAYIGMGQGSRCVQHLSEDKSENHPEFHEYLMQFEDPKEQLDIIHQSLESKRTAESHEAKLIIELNPRLNRNKGQVRNSVFTSQKFTDLYNEFEKSKWTPWKELCRITEKYGESLSRITAFASGSFVRLEGSMRDSIRFRLVYSSDELILEGFDTTRGEQQDCAVMIEKIFNWKNLTCTRHPTRSDWQYACTISKEDEDFWVNYLFKEKA